DFCIAQDMVAIRADSKKVDPKYLFAVLRSPDIQGEIENLHVGTLIPHFKKGDFGKLLIPLPRKELQEYIGEQYFLFSAKIDLLHRQNKTLEGMAEALWRKMFVEGAKTDWPTKQLKDLCTITRGASPRPIIEYVKDGTVPWIKIADATASGSYFIDRTNEFIIEAGVSKSVKVSPGDLILSNSATCGFPYFVELEGCIHDGWLLFRNFMGISKLFVFFFLKQLNEELNYIADGSVQNNLNTGLLKEYKLKAPPFNLVKDFDDFGEIAVTRIRKNTIQIRTLSRLRDTLLPKLMSGEVRVKL
ncbi:MAG: restriction endonuclease subunit S, partial [Proteobacteria bacterium]|nr:restriction endonuclease subunit S [Pseudomonadota bacterium]